MKGTNQRSGKITINILLSIGISLIVNFSYLVFLLLSTSSNKVPPHPHNHDALFISIEMVYYGILSFILLTVFTRDYMEGGSSRKALLRRLSLAALITVCLFFTAPTINRKGDIMIVLSNMRFNPMIVLKCSFILVVTALYGTIYDMIAQKQRITVENERLKTENIRSRYEVLASQMNPHFLFNSLTSLSMLVREGKTGDALTYIDRLSDTFRYIIQSGKNSLTTLREEMAFLDSYKYLLEIRYAGKLFIDTEVPKECLEMGLPSLTLQPLVENAVKHNTITRSRPLHVAISAGGGYLTVSNPIQPKLERNDKGTGIGLKNISSRYKLLTNREVEIADDGKVFSVRLPLSPMPASQENRQPQ